MHIVKTQTDKIVVGTNDTSYTAPDTSPTISILPSSLIPKEELIGG